MDSCWAACLGNCSNKLSREHLVSASLFTDKKVKVQGYEWCKDNPVEIGIAGLTSKILCAKHNNDLSPVDSVGAAAFDAFRQSTGLMLARGVTKHHRWNVKHYRINGIGLERWCLKTLINLSCNRGNPIGRDSKTMGRPSDRLVRIAYGFETFANRAGLYFVVRQGMEIAFEDAVQFAPLIKLHQNIEGGLFTFRGPTLLLFLEPEGPPEPLTGIFLAKEDIGKAQLNYHNKEMKATIGKYLSHIIHIDW
jgi:hypothetical protein